MIYGKVFIPRSTKIRMRWSMLNWWIPQKILASLCSSKITIFMTCYLMRTRAITARYCSIFQLEKFRAQNSQPYSTTLWVNWHLHKYSFRAPSHCQKKKKQRTNTPQYIYIYKYRNLIKLDLHHKRVPALLALIISFCAYTNFSFVFWHLQLQTTHKWGVSYKSCSHIGPQLGIGTLWRYSPIWS